MRIDELIGKDKNSLTRKESEYLLSCDAIKTTRFVNENEVVEIEHFEDGSYTKIVSTDENDWNGNEIASSEEELNSLVSSGKYSIEVIEYN